MDYNLAGKTLLIPDKDDIERDAVESAWKEKGGQVIRVAKFWEPPTVDSNVVKVYGNSMFCLILAEKLGLTLVSPKDDILDLIDEKWLKRRIEIMCLKDAVRLIFPVFIKPLVPKIFTAKIYNDINELTKECRQLDDATQIITSEIVKITAEARSFICNNEIKAISLYEGEEDLSQAEDFISDFLNENGNLFPISYVLDVGFIESKGWAVIEANPAWGAGLNGCSAEKAIDCITRATL